MEKLKQFWTDHKEAIIVGVVAVVATIAVTKIFFNVTKKKHK